MIRRLPLILVVALLGGIGTVGAENVPTPLKTVLNSAKRKDKVLIAGKIKRARTLDIFVLVDDTGEVLINAAGVRTTIGVGTELVVWGRFWGRSDRSPDLREIEVIDAAQAGTPAARALIEAHAVPAPVPVAVPVPASAEGTAADAAPAPSEPAARTTESRLRELDALKAKGLVSDAEYQEQRKRILSDL